MKFCRPNTRMQRTRSSASPPRSPLMRSPLGPPAKTCVLIVVLIALSQQTLLIAYPADSRTEMVFAWSAFEKDPSSKTANRVCELISKGATGEIDFYSSLVWLGPRMRAGDRWATRVAFCFRSIADGAFGEDLESELGYVIRPQPLIFLEELNRRVGATPDDARRFVISFGTDEWAESANPHQDYLAELEARRAALRALHIDNAAVRRLRGYCVRFLTEEINHPTWYE